MPAAVSQVLGQQREFRILRRPIPRPVPVQLIVDSGSKRTSLIPEVIRQLQPYAAGKVRVETSLAVGESQLFWIRFEFPTSSLQPIAQVAAARLELPRSLAGFHGIIGRDVLRQWDWVLFRGRRRYFTVRDSVPWFFALAWVDPTRGGAVLGRHSVHEHERRGGLPTLRTEHHETRP